MKNPINIEATPEEALPYLEVLVQLPFSLRERDSGIMKPVSLKPFNHKPCYKDQYLGLQANQILIKKPSYDTVIIIEPEIELREKEDDFVGGQYVTPNRKLDSFFPKETWDNSSLSDFSMSYGLLMGIPWDSFTAWRGYIIRFKQEGKEKKPFALLGPYTHLIDYPDMHAHPPTCAP